MKFNSFKIGLLSFSVCVALFPLDVLASKLTVEQRLELLEAELSANKKELRKVRISRSFLPKLTR